MADIDNRTKIGLFVALGMLPVVVSSVFFVAMIYFRAEAAEVRAKVTEDRLDRQSVAMQEQRGILIELRERTARMEATLNAMAHK